MWSIFRKEVNLFFSSLIGYITIIVFLVVTGLFIWVFPGGLNILQSGFATLGPFFDFAPLVLMFLIPALTMRSFAEEKSTGTLEALVTRPVSDWGIVTGKYLASVVLLLFALLPTILYVYTISRLAMPVGEIDAGGILGSYIGLLLLGSAFVSIGLLASTLTSNQIVAFILGIFLCFAVYYAFDFISRIPSLEGNADYLVRNIGMQEHYISISRGVLDTRDLVYFLSINGLFVMAAKTVLEARKW
jgi:ABC-2 type transport system permease protein